jgi:ankyrin repeat protein
MAAPKSLPARPSVEYLKKLAKKRLRALRADDPRAKLADAQLAVAREHGFVSWRKLSARAETAAAAASEDPFLSKLPKHRRTHKIAQWKPLMDAAYTGDVERARKLLEAGADPNVVSTTPHRYRPLHRAIEFKKTFRRTEMHEAVVKLLLERGADPKLRGTFVQHTALQVAATGEPRFVPILLPHFQPLDVFHACAVGDDNRVETLLKKDPSLAKSIDANDWTPLHYCRASAMFTSSNEARDALVRVAKTLLDRGADPMASFTFFHDWPMRPLYHCCGQHNNPAVAEVLFEAGASPFDDETVYHAVDEGHAECVALIEKHADPKPLAVECGKCLSSMLHWGRTRGVKWLLDHGADPNHVNAHFGEAPLHGAVRHKCKDSIVQMLLDRGADPDLKGRDGTTPRQLAKRLNVRRILDLFAAEPVASTKGGRR